LEGEKLFIHPIITGDDRRITEIGFHRRLSFCTRIGLAGRRIHVCTQQDEKKSGRFKKGGHSRKLQSPAPRRNGENPLFKLYILVAGTVKTPIFRINPHYKQKTK